MHYALRTLGRKPGFAVPAILTLALGVGVNAAIFAVVYSMVLRPLPFGDPDELTALTLDTRLPIYSKREFLFLRDNLTTFSQVGARGPGRGAVLLTDDNPRSVTTSSMSADFLQLLGIEPLAGREFAAGDADLDFGVVMISETMWRSRFDANPAVIGTTLRLKTREGESTHSILGVTPRSVDLLMGSTVAVWHPIELRTNLATPGSSLKLFGRTAEGVRLATAQAEFTALLASMTPETRPRASTALPGTVRSLHETVRGDHRRVLYLLLGAASVVLLMSCANVSGLFVVRGVDLRRELAIRTALGASRTHISRLMLTQSAIVASLGVGIGLLAAAGTLNALRAIIPPSVMGMGEIRFDPVVLVIGFGVAIVASVVFGFASIGKLGAGTDGLLAGTRISGGRGARRAQEGLLTVQVALAVALLATAGALVKTMQFLLSQDPGLAVENVMTAGIEVARTTADQTNEFLNTLIARITMAPDVEAAAATYHLPLSGSASITTVRIPDGAVPADESQTVGFQIASADLFTVLGIPMLRGRSFSANPEEAARELVVNQAFAESFWPGLDAVGQRVLGEREYRVIGVVGNTRHLGLGVPPRPEVFFPTIAFNRANHTILVRTALSPSAVTSLIRTTANDLDPTAPVTPGVPMADVLLQSEADRQRVLRLLEVFSFLALCLGGVGAYGVMTYLTTSRRHELGIRMALGATGTHVFGTVLARGAGLAGVGILLGAGLTVASSNLVEGLVVGARPVEPVALAAAATTLLIVILAAGFRPAWRAGSLSPATVLRNE